jgi:hypothetical protein
MTTQEGLIPNEPAGKPSVTKKRYTKPNLKHYGSLRSQTLGVSGGVGESGNPSTRKNALHSPARKT